MTKELHAIGIDANMERPCGIGTAIVQEISERGVCGWWENGVGHHWFRKIELPQQIKRHNLRMLEEPIDFEILAPPDTILFASTEYLDFCAVTIPFWFAECPCVWHKVSRTNPETFATFVPLNSAKWWLNDLSAMCVHQVDKRIRRAPSDFDIEDGLLEKLLFALSNALQRSLRLRLFLRICAMLPPEKAQLLFTYHVAKEFPCYDWQSFSGNISRLMYEIRYAHADTTVLL